jgi:aspartate ammonia-lyase
MRKEKDLLGERDVPVSVYYGIHTLRAVENFPLTGQPMHPALIKALAMVKKAAAEANRDLGFLDENIGNAIVSAADEVMQGCLMDQFPIDARQGGAGTSANMNINEVLANRAIELLGGVKGNYHLVHPITHVNMHQSTNDVYPTAVRVAAIEQLRPVSEACALLQEVLQEKEAEFAGIIKMGRTQLQDAVPIMLGQEFSAYAQAIGRDRWRIYKVEERLRQINLGGTAVGTGLNAERKYIYLANEKLRNIARMGVARAENMIDLTQNADVFVEVSGLLKALAVNLVKISNDLRLMSSGPRAGLGEINLPERQAGSTIMPGKVNPIIPEAASQVAFQVMSNDLAITLGAQAGQLELNAMMPLIAHNLLQSLTILHNGIHMLNDACLRGITANAERCKSMVENSYGLITALAPHIGYDIASDVAKTVASTGKTVRELVLERRLMTEAELDIVLNPWEMTKPGIAGKKARKELS